MFIWWSIHVAKSCKFFWWCIFICCKFLWWSIAISYKLPQSPLHRCYHCRCHCWILMRQLVGEVEVSSGLTESPQHHSLSSSLQTLQHRWVQYSNNLHNPLFLPCGIFLTLYTSHYFAQSKKKFPEKLSVSVQKK